MAAHQVKSIWKERVDHLPQNKNQVAIRPLISSTRCWETMGSWFPVLIITLQHEFSHLVIFSIKYICRSFSRQNSLNRNGSEIRKINGGSLKSIYIHRWVNNCCFCCFGKKAETDIMGKGELAWVETEEKIWLGLLCLVSNCVWFCFVLFRDEDVDTEKLKNQWRKYKKLWAYFFFNFLKLGHSP